MIIPDLFDKNIKHDANEFGDLNCSGPISATQLQNRYDALGISNKRVSTAIHTYEIVFPIEPKAIQSVKHRIITPKNGKPFASMYQPKANLDFKEYISTCAKSWVSSQITPFKPLLGAIGVNIQYTYGFMKSHSQKKRKEVAEGKILWKTTNPDMMDNLQKGWIDALKGILWHDDGQICDCTGIRKIYGEEPSIRLRFWSLEEEQKVVVG